MQEIYILCERLKRFLREAEKVATVARDRSSLSLVKGLKIGAESSLKPVISTRSRHVHEYRFQSDELRDLETLVLLTKGGKMRSLRWVRKTQYLKALRKWHEQLQKNNKATLDLCVRIFEETTKIIKRHEPAPGPVVRS